ncbi:sulfatase [Pedobacter sp. BAL39]|uniref:arylsulfatase n=1 Tax=Pedobacter sp. BAL39 TaxID=391596 RepID=UPI000155A155|nr:arylsulfatase [Pedobacter sp. BAL39]EDM35342.1 sulfatase [Pedobacter sp. BAL39]
MKIAIQIMSCLFLWALSTTPVTAQKKQPNIILIMADDMGYSDIGSYGGEIKTPHIDGLAATGIRFKQFYNAARCCPTRASLMTGVYPHQAGMGWMAAADMGTPAYSGNLNNNSVTIAEVLRTAGYGTYMTGKWHLTNERKIDGNVKDNWPKQRGFNRYFGIIPGGANYFTPELYSDNRRYQAPEDFYLTNAISDTSVKFIGDHFTAQPEKPMFMYVAYTSPHWPLHALQKDIDKYKDTYQKGWDLMRKERYERQVKMGLFPPGMPMSARDPDVPAWDKLSKDQQEKMAKRMAIYAAQIDIMDQGIGRIIAKLKAEDQLDNTLIFFLSDNGACAEFISSGASKELTGEADTFESYRINWANLSSTPFKEYKHYTFEGGIETPLIVHWPAGISQQLNNSFVKGYGNLSDIMATCVDVARASYPATFNGHQIIPLEGKSISAAFTGKPMERGKIFWEHEANIAFRDGKWKLVASTPENAEFDPNTLRLYDLDADPIEMNDCSKAEPERLKAMYAEWQQWGKRVDVFPLSTKGYGARIQEHKRVINGSFDDLLGGWKLNKDTHAEALAEIDTTGRISGKNALKVNMIKPTERPNGVMLAWPFQAKKGEKFNIGLKARGNQKSTILVRLEKAGGDFHKVIDQEFLVDTQTGSGNFSSVEIPADGNYRIGLYFGKLEAGNVVWVDDVTFNTL